MTDSQTPVQDTSAPQPKPISIKPPSKSLAEVIARTLVDLLAIGITGAAMLTRIAPYEISYGMIALLVGIRISDIATVRKSSGGGDPPIAGGLAGALFAMFTTHHS